MSEPDNKVIGECKKTINIFEAHLKNIQKKGQ